MFAPVASRRAFTRDLSAGEIPGAGAERSADAPPVISRRNRPAAAAPFQVAKQPFRGRHRSGVRHRVSRFLHDHPRHFQPVSVLDQDPSRDPLAAEATRHRPPECGRRLSRADHEQRPPVGRGQQRPSAKTPPGGGAPLETGADQDFRIGGGKTRPMDGLEVPTEPAPAGPGGVGQAGNRRRRRRAGREGAGVE